MPTTLIAAISGPAASLLLCVAAIAAELELPQAHYGNLGGCEYLATGNIDTDEMRYASRSELGAYASSCRFVHVTADTHGNQRAAGICSYEGEDFLTAEDFIIAPPLASGALAIYASDGERWAELSPCP